MRIRRPGKKTSFIISLVLHVLVLGVAFTSGGGAGKGKGNADQEEGKIKEGAGGQQDKFTSIIPMYKRPEPDPITMTLTADNGTVPVKPTPTATATPKPKESPVPSPTPINCDHWYGGVGFYFGYDQWGREIAERVIAGYPAALAGIKDGDVVIPLTDKDVRGEPGTHIRVGIIRGELRFELDLVRAKICEEWHDTSTGPSSFPLSMPTPSDYQLFDRKQDF